MMTRAMRFLQLPPSPLPGVSDQAWYGFMSAMVAQPVTAVSPTGGLGAYAMRPHRLVEIDVATNFRREGGGRVQACDMSAPRSLKGFLTDPLDQYELFVRSCRLYNSDLEAGRLTLPAGATRAEALAALHVGGVTALADWDNLFERTRKRCEAVRGLF